MNIFTFIDYISDNMSVLDPLKQIKSGTDFDQVW